MHLSIKDVPESWVQRLRERALRNHRSLQGELMAIVERAMADEAHEVPGPGLPHAPAHQVISHGWKTIEQLLAERKSAGWKPDPAMAHLPLGVDIIRADRDSR